VSSQYRDLKQAMLGLRNGNPDGYEIFLGLLNDYTMDALKALSTAPTDEVLVQQGRCQQLRSLMRMFVECDQKTKTDEPTPQ
jgi:hypothetical protein